jgi:hypothetical protein
MKKNSIFFFGVLLFIQFLLVGGVWGQSAGFNNTFIVLSLNGGANTYYDLNATTTNQDFNGANLGSFAPGSSNLTLKGAEHNVYKCGSSDLTSTRLNYRIYLTASPSGAYTSPAIGYSSTTGNGCGGQDQVWSNTGLTTNLLSGLSAGAYTIEVYSDATVTNCCGGTVYASNSSNNYKATFTIIGDFYSKSTGNLETLSNWGSNTDGTGTAPANFTSNGVTFNIRNNATPSIGASWTVSGTGSKIVVGDGTNACNFTVPSTFIVTSPTTNVSNNGTITRTTSGANNWGALSFASGATYVHNTSGGGTLPSATWNASSTLQINASLTAGTLAESYGNVNYNSSAIYSINTTAFNIQSGATFTILQGTVNFALSQALTDTWGGNLTLSGGTFNVNRTPTSSGHAAVLTINNLTVSSGTLNLFNDETAHDNTGADATLNVNGNLVLSGGLISMLPGTSGTTTPNTVVNLNLVGNFTWSGGELRRTNTNNSGPFSTFDFTGTGGTQTFTQNLGSTTYQSSGRGLAWAETGTSLVDINYIGTSGTANNLTTPSGNVSVACSGTCTYATNLTIASGKTLTVGSTSPANITARLDMGANILTLTGSAATVHGFLRSAGTFTGATTTTLTFSATGTYEHNFTTTAGVIPTATWSTGSTCAVIGYTSNTSATGGLNQTFSDFIWNCVNQNSSTNLNGGLIGVIRNLTIASTGTAQLRLGGSSSTWTSTITGNFSVQGGSLGLIGSGSAGAGAATINVSGNFSISGGILDFNVASNASSSSLNIGGDFLQTGGTIIRSFTALSSFNFVKSSGIQTFTQSAGTISNTINWNVGNGTTNNTVQLGSNVNLGTGTGTFTVLGNATFDAGTNVLSGSAASTFNSGATVITANSLGVNGSITLSGTRTYNAATNYTFNGSSAQVTGASVTSANNLIQNNSAGLTLDSPVTVSNNLTMTAGNITTTPTNILTLGNSAPASLTWTSGKVVGPMKRWMAAATNSGASSSMFPLGSPTRNAQASIEYTTAPTTAGYLEAKFVASNPTSVVPYPSPLTDQFNYVLNNVVSEGYWEIKPSATSGVDGGAYTVTLEGETISLAASTNASYTDVRVIKSPVPHSSWVLQGAHGTATGANADFTVSRTGMSGYSYFAMAYPTSAPLPVELVSFAANCADNNTVSVNWTTASEHNSDYYTVEKSRDGISWNVLKTIPAAGNSTQLINYSVADVADISGTVYYRLTQVDIDGASKMYDIVSTNCSSESELSLIAYPNPSNGQFTVKIENALGGKYDLAITDMQGKAIEVQSLDLETGTTVVKLNPVGLQPGVYLLQFIQDGNKLQQQKLIIE